MKFTKVCSKCSNEKSLNDFRKQSACKDGLQTICADCMDRYGRGRYSNKREELIAKNLEYQAKNKDKHNDANKKYSKSVLGRLNRGLNRRMDILLGENRESFASLIGVAASVLIVHLTGIIPKEFVLEDYGRKWKVQFIDIPTEEELKSDPKKYFNWKNLTVREKNISEKRDFVVK